MPAPPEGLLASAEAKSLAALCKASRPTLAPKVWREVDAIVAAGLIIRQLIKVNEVPSISSTHLLLALQLLLWVDMEKASIRQPMVYVPPVVPITALHMRCDETAIGLEELAFCKASPLRSEATIQVAAKVSLPPLRISLMSTSESPRASMPTQKRPSYEGSSLPRAETPLSPAWLLWAETTSVQRSCITLLQDQSYIYIYILCSYKFFDGFGIAQETSERSMMPKAWMKRMNWQLSDAYDRTHRNIHTTQTLIRKGKQMHVEKHSLRPELSFHKSPNSSTLLPQVKIAQDGPSHKIEAHIDMKQDPSHPGFHKSPDLVPRHSWGFSHTPTWRTCISPASPSCSCSRSSGSNSALHPNRCSPSQVSRMSRAPKASHPWSFEWTESHSRSSRADDHISQLNRCPRYSFEQPGIRSSCHFFTYK